MACMSCNNQNTESSSTSTDQTSSSSIGFANGSEGLCKRCFSFWILLAVAVVAYLIGRK